MTKQKAPKSKKCFCGGFFNKYEGVEYRAIINSVLKRGEVCSEGCLPFAKAQFQEGTRFWQVRYLGGGTTRPKQQ